MAKIFGIGLNKTGTSTLGAVCSQLGLRSKSWDRELFASVTVQNDLDTLWHVIEDYDAFDDFPYPLFYREIDRRFPGSKFVLTRRTSANAWLASLKAHSMRARHSSITNETVYGARFPHGREQAFINYYNTHLNAVRDYFAGRNTDFFEICWEDCEDLGPFSEFLGLGQLSGPPPRTNSRRSKIANPFRYIRNWSARLAGA